MGRFANLRKLVKLRAGNNPNASFKGITGGLSVDWLFTIQGTSQPGSFSFERCIKNNGAALGLINNGLGSPRITGIRAGDGIVTI